MTDLIKFDFQGDQLDVVPEGEKVWVGIRRVCESLGVSFSKQLRKLKSDPSMGVAFKATPSAGGIQETACIDLRSLPLWLATIHPKRVRVDIAEKLIAYKRECADALADHFLGRRGGDSAIVEAMKVQAEQMSARLASLEAQIFALTCRTIEAAKPSIGPGAARTYVLDPLREIARTRARALKQTSPRTIQSLRASAERALRRELAFPPDRNMRWELFPASRLGEACCVIARMHGDALELARVAAGPAKQTKLALVRA